MLAYVLDQIESVHPGHVRIGEHQREGYSGGLRLLQEAQGGVGALGHDRFHAPTPQHFCQNPTVRGVVIHGQHTQVGEAGGQRRPGRLNRGCNP